MHDIGKLLREARESKGISIQDAAREMKTRERHIQMLEDARFSELSKDIYLKGFLKTYTHWLNIDGSTILSQIDRDKKSIAAKHKVVPVKSADFSFLIRIIRNSKLNIIFLSIILTAVIYSFWYNKSRNIADIDASVATSPLKNIGIVEKYSNVREEYRNMELVFLPRAHTELKITNTESGEETIHHLEEGDVLFQKPDDNTVISADKPALVDVFTDGNVTQDPIGSLDTILIQSLY